MPWDKIIVGGEDIASKFLNLLGGGSKPPTQPQKPASDPNMPLYVLGGLAVLLVVLRSRK